jgi:hypothetical protein
MALLLATPVAAGAQQVEVAAFGGYRAGGDLFEEAAGTPLDLDGGLAIGAIVDVFLDDRTAVAVTWSHQQATVDLPGTLETPWQRETLSIDHLLVGGTEQFGTGRVRPFLTGALGLTRFGADDDAEVRFAVAAGGGVKAMASRHVGLRLDGRVYAVFVDGGVGRGICVPAGCVVGVHVSTLWQAEFTAGLVLAF